MNSKKGFTLIELLVVIAIIGILSGTVVVSMSGAQGTAKDARIKSSLGQIRTATEVYKFGDGGGYYKTAMWTEDTAISTLLSDINAQGGAARVVGIDHATEGTKWCVSKILVGASTTHWCVSNTGFNAAGTCGSTAVCTSEP